MKPRMVKIVVYAKTDLPTAQVREGLSSRLPDLSLDVVSIAAVPVSSDAKTCPVLYRLPDGTTYTRRADRFRVCH